MADAVEGHRIHQPSRPGAYHTHAPVQPRLWWLVAAEFGLAVSGGILARFIDYFDSLLADKYTRHVSIEVMRHASQLDLIAYEDPTFYDRLERARVQATDRLAMIQQMGRLIQMSVTAVAFSAVLVRYSPFLLLLLVAGIIPAFLGESHFAFLSYAANVLSRKKIPSRFLPSKLRVSA